MRIWTHVCLIWNHPGACKLLKDLLSWLETVYMGPPPGSLPVPFMADWLFRNCLPHGLSPTTLLPAFRICQWLLSPLGDLPVCPLPYGPSNTLFVSPAPESDWPGFAFSLYHLHQLSDLGWFLYLFELQSPRLNNNSYLEIALRIKWETVHGKQLAQGLVCNKALNKC